MEPFLGKWELEKSCGLSEVLRQLGVKEDLLKAPDDTKNTIEILDLHDGQYKFHCGNQVKDTDHVFSLGKPFTESTPDGRTVTSTITVDDGVMKHEQVGDGKTTSIVRTIEKGQMKTVMKVDDQTCERWYKKV
ncbi:unnamed protein product [Hymenolepis diminuta]|uniref:FABP domain-containing protein n=1 Tax=Hymenolepis diminuta TaxID=6216 RepID=A0A0R3SJ88_HYMDI|nr:unnamed protein product [Hymenolepis diminuta]VUZ52024.1 unnamed protein product [Hymenolepis diminuta]